MEQDLAAQRYERSHDPRRLIALSDGVFAIVLTLMVLDPRAGADRCEPAPRCSRSDMAVVRRVRDQLRHRRDLVDGPSGPLRDASAYRSKPGLAEHGLPAAVVDGAVRRGAPRALRRREGGDRAVRRTDDRPGPHPVDDLAVRDQADAPVVRGRRRAVTS